MLWRLMRFGWLAFCLLCSSRTTVDLLHCTWVRLQWDVAHCILSEKVRLVHLSAGQLRHQLSSSLPYRDLGWEPADRLNGNLWLAREGITMSIPFPAGCLPDPVFSWQPSTLILHVLMCMVIFSSCQIRRSCYRELYRLQTTSCWSLWKVMCGDGRPKT